MHPIDETSPLYGLSSEELKKSSAEFLILLSGTDETFSQTVYTRSSYRSEEVIWNARFASVFNPLKKGGEPTIDVGRIHMIQMVESIVPEEPSRLAAAADQIGNRPCLYAGM